MRLGYAAYKERDYQSATFYFHAALEEIPNDRDATIAFWNAQNGLKQQGTPLESPYDRYMDMGYNATEQSDYAMALEYFKKALSERPNNYYAVQAIRNVNTYLNRGTEATTTGDLSTSSDFYLGELAYDRYMRLGYAAQQRKDYPTALTYFRSALYDRPDDREATNQKNYQQALEFFARALEQRPNDYYASQAIRNVNTYINRVETISRQ
jgi:tetratricopeptide (TPR) repeat protein